MLNFSETAAKCFEIDFLPFHSFLHTDCCCCCCCCKLFFLPDSRCCCFKRKKSSFFAPSEVQFISPSTLLLLLLYPDKLLFFSSSIWQPTKRHGQAYLHTVPAGLRHWIHDTDGSLPWARLDHPLPWAIPRFSNPFWHLQVVPRVVSIIGSVHP